jgi:hypothetical protein
MIVNDLDIFRCTFAPGEADSPLIVYPDTVLTLPLATQRLKPVSRHRRHVLQFLGVLQHPQLPPRRRTDDAKSAALLPPKELLGLLAPEGSDHT